MVSLVTGSTVEESMDSMEKGSTEEESMEEEVGGRWGLSMLCVHSTGVQVRKPPVETVFCKL